MRQCFSLAMQLAPPSLLVGEGWGCQLTFAAAQHDDDPHPGAFGAEPPHKGEGEDAAP
jgi:hypothetical protein